MYTHTCPNGCTAVFENAEKHPKLSIKATCPLHGPGHLPGRQKWIDEGRDEPRKKREAAKFKPREHDEYLALTHDDYLRLSEEDRELFWQAIHWFLKQRSGGISMPNVPDDFKDKLRDVGFSWEEYT